MAAGRNKRRPERVAPSASVNVKFPSSSENTEMSASAPSRNVPSSLSLPNTRDGLDVTRWDHPEGVWTLPPSLALGKAKRAKYIGIGESDRLTLKFVKP